MTLDTFFEKFDQFADAPDAVAKMRKLILQLAVKGRLKSQGDESGFPQVRLDSLGAWAQGCGFPVAEQGHVDRPILFSKVSDMNLPGNEREILKTNHTIDEAAAKRLRIKVHPSGTVIFPKIGGAIATNKRRVLVRPTAIDNNCSGIIPNKSCSTRWLFLVLSAIDFAEYQSGTSVPAVNQGALGEIEVSLPPLAEQKRIVAKVDELMALCDRLEAQQQERETRHAALARASLARFADAPTPVNLNFLFHKSYAIPPADLRKSILTLAVQGKLVPQDPNDEPAEELFARIESTKEKLIKLRTIKRATVEANPSGDECESLPSGWLWTRLGNSFDVRDGTHDTPKYTTEGFPLITSKNIYSGSLLFDGANLISENDHRQISERSRVDRGDILFAMIGSIGNPVIVDTDREFSIKNVALFKYYAAADSEPRFLLLYLKLVAEEMKAKAAGGVQSFVSLGFLRNYLFPLPPLAEQRRIVAKVEQLMALVDALETQLAASRATAANLLSAVVAELAPA